MVCISKSKIDSLGISIRTKASAYQPIEDNPLDIRFIITWQFVVVNFKVRLF